jgi:hypothetical protein
MYVRTGEQRGYPAWKRTVRRGEVFVTSGPLITFRVSGAGPGGRLDLPGSGKVRIQADTSIERAA